MENTHEYAIGTASCKPLTHTCGSAQMSLGFGAGGSSAHTSLCFSRLWGPRWLRVAQPFQKQAASTAALLLAPQALLPWPAWRAQLWPWL